LNSLIIKLFYPATSGSSSLVGQSQSDEEKKMWDELSKRLMKSVQISAPVRVPPTRSKSKNWVKLTYTGKRSDTRDTPQFMKPFKIW